MTRDKIYFFISIMWILIIVLNLVTSITDYQKYKKLGKLYSVNKRRFTEYQVLSFMFAFLFLMSLLPLFTQNYSYSIYNSVGLLIVSLKTQIMSYRSPRLYEHGIILESVIINWDTVTDYRWVKSSKENIEELILVATFKQLLITHKNKDVKLSVHIEDKEKIQELLVCKGFNETER